MSSDVLGTSPTDSTSSIDINDAIFCEHGQEVCKECNFDAREENDAFFGFDPIDRKALRLPEWTKSPKDGSIQCKKHHQGACSQCFGWKKQLQKIHKDTGKKAKGAKNDSVFI